MSAPIYTTDLTTIAIGSITVDVGTWDESTDAGWDTAGAMVDDANLYYNGTACVSAQYTKDGNGSGTTGPGTIMYVHTSAFTIPTDGAALIHHLWAAPPALNTIGNATSAGINVLAGTTLGDFYAWKASGSDFAPAPKGGWTNYAINPAIGTPDHTVGTVTTYNMIGVAVSALAQARGNPQACNAVRYGRCESIFTDGDITNGYATLDGFALVDNISTNRWSLIDPIEGGYKWQGLMSIGTSGTPVDFRDSNRNINVANTINVTANFNKIEINNAASNVEWTAYSISALGTVSKGKFEVIDNATVLMTACTFTDLDTFIYQSNSTINGSIFRRGNTVTQGGATFDSCVFDKSIAASSILSNNPTLITNSDFNSDGSNHAIEITTPGTYSLTDNDFTDYATVNGSTGNEVIYNNSGGAVTINVAGSGIGVVSYRNGAGASTTVNNTKALTINIVDSAGSPVTVATEITVVKDSDTSELYHAEDVITGSTIYNFDGGLAGTAIYINALNVADYVPTTLAGITLPSSDSTVTIVLQDDLIYNNP